MVDIPPGSFLMGSAADAIAPVDERPQHEVTFKRGFRLGKYEVTFEQYCASTKRACPDDYGWGRGEQPVINVSWEDADRYIDWLNRATGETFRLPTEAEWEYAARGGTKGAHWWCEEQAPNCGVSPDVANCDGCTSTQGLEGIGNGTLPVGSFAANPFGLHDTTGNVWEWVQDCSHEDYKGAPTDGSAWLEADGGVCGLRVLRGRSWLNAFWNLGSADRDWSGAGTRNRRRGFRLAQDL